MDCEVKGKITAILDVKRGVTRDGKDWEAIEYLITEEVQYGKTVKFSMYSSDGPIVDAPQIGDKVAVRFNVSAREYNGKWFNDVRAWQIRKLQ